ncbi:hypothetical protein [Methylobacterium sp. J-068]|uniref:hypothetical protein n=1 Tax=Methylobacterium sp. J-068 TaxID=2836649 RepID=UPI001FB946D2|nr:hypothetical protein [Methylobacterium sp. J-068]MCJ2036078.1 hypothetical protein [Methylobacterium sp. J-068]
MTLAYANGAALAMRGAEICALLSCGTSPSAGSGIRSGLGDDHDGFPTRVDR